MQVGWLLLIVILLLGACSGNDEADETGDEANDTIKIGVLASLTGPLEAYGQQTVNGFKLGLDYATDGTREIAGKKIEMIVEDTETKSNVAVQKGTRLLEEEQVDFIVGSSSSGDTLAVLPLMEEYEKVMVAEPAVANSITGDNWNEYIFRTGRNSSQDAIAGAQAIAEEGVEIATLAPDYAFGRDGVAAFKKAAEKKGAHVIHEEYANPDAVDFTSNIQRIISKNPDYLFVIWAGSNTPWEQLADMNVQEQGIKVSTGAPDIAALKTMKAVTGMEGFTVYHHTLPDNDVNDWLVKEHKERFDSVPDLFTPGGMSAAMSIVTALEKTEGDTDTDQLIKTMEGMSFPSPKGAMQFRVADHQALQTMYAVTLKEKEGFDYPVPVLDRVLQPEETSPPIQNGR